MIMVQCNELSEDATVHRHEQNLFKNDPTEWGIFISEVNFYQELNE